MLNQGVDPKDREGVVSRLNDFTLELKFTDGKQTILLNGEDVGDSIRTPEVSMAASAVSAIPAVREYLLNMQRSTARRNSVIMDGRDIGTVILPNAEVKIFLTASPKARAQRRYDELIAKGQSVISSAELIKRGYYISFSGVLTFKNAARLPEVAKMVPLDRMLLETDCPYLAPHPHRGKRNDSTLMRYTAEKLAEILCSKGASKVVVTDLSRCDMAEAVEDAFRYSHMAVCAASYDADVFPPMYDFLHHLKLKNFQNRKVAIMENGSWAPTAGRVMRAMLEGMKNVEIVEPVVTIRSRMKEEDIPAMEQMATALLS